MNRDVTHTLVSREYWRYRSVGRSSCIPRMIWSIVRNPRVRACVMMHTDHGSNATLLSLLTLAAAVHIRAFTTYASGVHTRTRTTPGMQIRLALGVLDPRNTDNTPYAYVIPSAAKTLQRKYIEPTLFPLGGRVTCYQTKKRTRAHPRHMRLRNSLQTR